MSKVTLEYNIDEPEEKMALLRAIKSTEMACAIFELKHNLRKKVEWYVDNNIDDKDPDAKYQVMKYIMERVMEELDEFNTNELIS